VHDVSNLYAWTSTDSPEPDGALFSTFLQQLNGLDSAGGIAGGAISVTGRSRFEREWIACMESRGYRIVATPTAIH